MNLAINFEQPGDGGTELNSDSLSVQKNGLYKRRCIMKLNGRIFTVALTLISIFILRMSFIKGGVS